MKTLKDLYQERLNIHSERITRKLNRVDMTYVAKYHDMSSDKVDCKFLKKELNQLKMKTYTMNLPCLVSIPVDDGTLVIYHLKKNTDVFKALLELGYSE